MKIAAHRDKRLRPLRPQRGNDIGAARTPVEPRQDGALHLQRIHEVDYVGGQRRLLTIAERASDRNRVAP